MNFLIQILMKITNYLNLGKNQFDGGNELINTETPKIWLKLKEC